MSPVEETVATLRRGHLALVLVGVTLLGLAIPRANLHQSAIAEARALRSLLEDGGIEAICGEAAERLFDDYWETVLDEAQRRSGRAVTLGDEFELGFTAHCPHPSASRRVSDIRGFLEEGLWVDLPTPADTALAGLLARNAGQGVLASADVRWSTPPVDTLTERVVLAPISDVQLQSINAGEDSIEVVMVFAGERGPEEAGAGLDTVGGGDTATGPSGPGAAATPAAASISAQLPGTIFQELLPPEQFLADDERWRSLVGEATGGLPLPILPELRRYWYEVERLPPADVIAHLEERSALHETTAQAFGFRVGLDTLGIVGAAAVLVLLLQMTMHVTHLARLTPTDRAVVGRLPWSPLYRGSLAGMAAWASLVALPAAALGLLAYRLLLDATVLGGAVALAALGGIVLGVRILLDLRRIKLGG